MTTDTRVRINENGRIVLPQPFRKALGVHAGDEILLRMEDDELRITTLKQRIQKAQQLVRKHVKRGTSLSNELIRERREASKRE